MLSLAADSFAEIDFSASFGVAIFILDSNLNIIKANRRALLLSRRLLQSKTLLKKPIHDLFPVTASTRTFLGTIFERLQSEKTPYFSFSFLEIGFQKINFMYALLPIFNKKQEMIGLILKARYFSKKKLELSFYCGSLVNTKELFIQKSQVRQNAHYFGLSVQQSECLYHYLHGRSISEIANVLSLSCGTVQSYLEDLKFKFKCSTRSQLIKKASDRGIYVLKN